MEVRVKKGKREHIEIKGFSEEDRHHSLKASTLRKGRKRKEREISCPGVLWQRDGGGSPG